MVREHVGRDGSAFWMWKVVDPCGWTLVSGTVRGAHSEALEKARATIAACEQSAKSCDLRSS